MVFTAQQDTSRNNSMVYCSDTPIQSKFCTNSPHRTITVRMFFMFEKKMSSLFLNTRFHSNRKYGFLIFVGAMALLAFRYWKFWVFRYPRTYPAFTQPKMIRLDEKQYRAVKKMTRAACANNDCGNCLLLDDGEPCVCVQSISYSLLCRYFREAVLPADRQLCEQITRSGETDLKRCAVCGSTFAAGSNRAKYCPDCAAKIRRRQKAESERNRRLRIKTTT